MNNSLLKISIIAIATHLLLIFFGPYIVMNQLDRNIADAIACLLYTSPSPRD